MELPSLELLEEEEERDRVDRVERVVNRRMDSRETRGEGDREEREPGIKVDEVEEERELVEEDKLALKEARPSSKKWTRFPLKTLL